jgi:NAD(P)-dependent dehydrogenase (short-subunit alcohol dehydrogenase family)
VTAPDLGGRVAVVTGAARGIDALVAAACIKRIGTVHDLVRTLLFLCTDAASWVTAQALVVDGGVTAPV